VQRDGEHCDLEALKEDAPKSSTATSKGGLFLTDQMFTESPLPARTSSTSNPIITASKATARRASLRNSAAVRLRFCGGPKARAAPDPQSLSGVILFEVGHLHREHGYTGFISY